MAIQEGKPAPDFELEGSDGKTHRLADYRGKTVVVYFYPKDNTPGCTKESCGFRDLAPAWAKDDVVILGVSADSLKSHANFIGKYDLNFPLLSDPDKTMLNDWDAFGEKKLYGKVYQGIIRSTVIVGPDGIVLKHWPKVTRAAQHPEQVAEFFEAAKAG